MRLRECWVATQEMRSAAQEEKRETAHTARANEICVGLTMQKYDRLMCEALTTKCQESKPLTSWWWLKPSRNFFGTFPENWHSKSSYLRSWRYCNFADWFWKKPDFSIVFWGKARFRPKYVHFSGCSAKQHHGRSGQCKMGLTGLQDSCGSWHLYICRFLFGLLTFYVTSLLCYKEKWEPLDCAMANFKRS